MLHPTLAKPRHEVPQQQHDQRLIVPIPGLVQHRDRQLVDCGGTFRLVKSVK